MQPPAAGNENTRTSVGDLPVRTIPRCHARSMNRTLRAGLSAAVLAIGVVATTACALYLAHQGLDRASKWVSLVVGPTSLVLSATGLLLGWRTRSAGGTVERTGNATAFGRGSRASTGLVGEGPHQICDTGDAEARNGGRASTGVDNPRSGR